MENVILNPVKTPKDKYLQVIENTQLISIDMIVRVKINNTFKYIVGERKNNPAKDYLFVPGCRIYKEMKINNGVRFVLEDEYGLNLDNISNDPKFLGCYEHIYSNNFSNNDFQTHYVVFAYLLTLNENETQLLNMKKLLSQHHDIIWLNKNDIINNEKIHQYTKNYFCDKSRINAIFRQIEELD